MAQKKRAQGGGRTANSEPRQQVFKEFNGCNFELSPRDFTLGKEVDQEQSDLQMNYVVVQHNVEVASNKTLQSRNNIIKIMSTKGGDSKIFTGAAIQVGERLFAAQENSNNNYFNDIIYADISGTPGDDGFSTSYAGQTWYGDKSGCFTDFEYVDNKLVALSKESTFTKQGIWTCADINNPEFVQARKISNPDPILYGEIGGRGSLTISDHQTNTCPFRVTIAQAFTNEFGPTKVSAPLIFYASDTPENWHSGKYLHIEHHFSQNNQDYVGNITGVELYYTSGNATNLQFLGRKDIGSTMNLYGFNWYGYLDVTNMWPVANLIAPTENYTSGPPASYISYIDSRLYFWGDKSNPYRLYIGGNSGNLFCTAPGVGGGFVDVEPGTNQEIKVVTKYKTQSGNSIVTMLCSSPNDSKEQRYNLVENQVSLSNEQSMKSWQAEQVAGAVGTKSPYGGIACADGLYSISRFGLALTTMTMEYNSQIQTNYVSDPIKPAFIDDLSSTLSNACILECDGIIYLAFRQKPYVFCYDINLKAWWSIDLDDQNEEIINLIPIDYEGERQGVGIITLKHIYMLPVTNGLSDSDSTEDESTSRFVIQTGELATQQPQQQWQYVSQLEFRFDYFLGDMVIELTGIDQFGRKVTTEKTISHDETMYNLREYMRVDLRLQSYQIRMTGTARFRMTHFIARVYTMSNKQGIVWGFDDSQSFRSFGDIHPTFKDYNDIKQAIIP